MSRFEVKNNVLFDGSGCWAAGSGITWRREAQLMQRVSGRRQERYVLMGPDASLGHVALYAAVTSAVIGEAIAIPAPATGGEIIVDYNRPQELTAGVAISAQDAERVFSRVYKREGGFAVPVQIDSEIQQKAATMAAAAVDLYDDRAFWQQVRGAEAA